MHFQKPSQEMVCVLQGVGPKMLGDDYGSHSNLLEILYLVQMFLFLSWLPINKTEDPKKRVSGIFGTVILWCQTHVLY
jgi:hypothetical protein